jgi:hypothetical protein
MLHPLAQQKPIWTKTSKSKIGSKAQTRLNRPWISSISNRPLFILKKENDNGLLRKVGPLVRVGDA